MRICLLIARALIGKFLKPMLPAAFFSWLSEDTAFTRSYLAGKGLYLAFARSNRQWLYSRDRGDLQIGLGGYFYESFLIWGLVKIGHANPRHRVNPDA